MQNLDLTVYVIKCFCMTLFPRGLERKRRQKTCFRDLRRVRPPRSDQSRDCVIFIRKLLSVCVRLTTR